MCLFVGSTQKDVTLCQLFPGDFKLKREVCKDRILCLPAYMTRFFCSKSIQLRGCVHLHHLSIDNSRVLAAVRGCRMWVVGLCCHWLYGDKLQGARGGVIWIWRTEKEFTHKETTNTSNHYIVSQRGLNGHTLSLSVCLITTPACPPKGSCHLLTLGIMSNISCLCQQTSFWMETIDHKDRFDFQTCGIASLW